MAVNTQVLVQGSSLLVELAKQETYWPERWVVRFPSGTFGFTWKGSRKAKVVLNMFGVGADIVVGMINANDVFDETEKMGLFC